MNQVKIMIGDEPTIKLDAIVVQYRDNAKALPLAIVDRLCAKLDVARTIYVEYDNALGKAVSDRHASIQTIESLVRILLLWNETHLDYKVLNTLVKASRRYPQMSASTIHHIHQHTDNLLCTE